MSTVSPADASSCQQVNQLLQHRNNTFEVDLPPPQTDNQEVAAVAVTDILSCIRDGAVALINERFHYRRTLQKSLFGQVNLMYDVVQQKDVAVKISRASLVTSHAVDTLARQHTLASQSREGVLLLEDVRREARILRWLFDPVRTSFSLSSIHRSSCGLGGRLLDMIQLSHPSVVSQSQDADKSKHPKASSSQSIMQILEHGAKNIAVFHAEVETLDHHYLVTEYVSGGDLFSVICAQVNNKLSEVTARHCFYHICCAVTYLHAQSIAHLDLSLENVCYLSDGSGVRLIDFGTAAQHPHYEDAGQMSDHTCDDRSLLSNVSPFITLLEETPEALEKTSAPPRSTSSSSGACQCATCTLSTVNLLQTDLGIIAAKRTQKLNDLRFLCRPICKKIAKPGKLGYLSPELINDQCWDAFAQDMFALGVMLYTMLTGRPPFTSSLAVARDPWFQVVYSGSWLTSRIRKQAPAAIYNTLSPNALHLINALIKPQHLRPTIDTVLKHPWFQSTHPGNTTHNGTFAPL